MVVVLNYT